MSVMIIRMAAPTLDAPSEAWQRVGALAQKRRLDLGRTAADVVARAGKSLSIPVLSRIENSQRERYSVATIAALCRGLDWAQNSVERILDGGAPVALESVESGGADLFLALEARVDQLEAELADIKAALADEPAGEGSVQVPLVPPTAEDLEAKGRSLGEKVVQARRRRRR